MFVYNKKSNTVNCKKKKHFLLPLDTHTKKFHCESNANINLEYTVILHLNAQYSFKCLACKSDNYVNSN